MIESLENNEQILLMYLADELPADDRVEVEQLLTSDASMRREFKSLQAAQAAACDGLAQLDECSPVLSADAAARRIGRDIRQKLARPGQSPLAPAAERSARSWRWLYPTVAAASIAIVAMMWLGNQATPTAPSTGLPSRLPNQVAIERQSREQDDALLIQSLQSQPASDEDTRLLAMSDTIPQDEISQYLLNADSGDE